MAKICPLLTFDVQHPEPCYEHRCHFYIQIQGTHPQTGEMLDKWGCAISWMPILTIENSQQQRQTGAAVESFRNNMTRQNNQLLSMMQQAKLDHGDDYSDNHSGPDQVIGEWP